MKLKTLTSHPRFGLHGLYFLLVFLVVIFLIFSAVSGPGTKYYWLTITSRADSKTGVPGDVWSLGGLGSCDNNKTCSVDAPHAKAVRGCLIWHLAVSLLFAILATIQEVLVLRPSLSICNPIVRSWLILLLPPLTFLPMIITLIADFAVRASIGSADDVESIKTGGSFWLSTVATVFALLWVFVAEYTMWRERNKQQQEQKDSEQKREEESIYKRRAGFRFIARLNPWGK